MKENNQKKIKKFSGIVVSDKMNDTIVVSVERAKKHSKYLKIYKVHRRYKVHDPKNQFKVGQEVEFVSCRPLSKDKKWRVLY